MSLIGGWLEFRRLRKQIRQAPAYHLVDLPEDTLARITGRARPLGQRALAAPLSGRTCVYYSVSVVARTAGVTTGARSLQLLATEQEAVAFMLEDQGMRAVIDPRNAQISTPYDYESRSRAVFDASTEQRELLVRHELVNRNWFDTIEVLYREAVIELDEEIVIVGGGTREPDPDAIPRGGYRDGGATRFRFTGTDRLPLVISDEPDTIA
ncbi:MAG: hypothetical protein SFX73_35670 [Kofleriaceae bacterium]|nr:hypothetical protein [Kofleriaceae bacterium]